MKQIFIGLFFLLFCQNGFTQDVIYFRNNHTIGKVTKLTSQEVYYEKDSNDKKTNINNVVAVFNSFGKFILPNELMKSSSYSLTTSYFFDKKLLKKDVIVFSNPFKLIYADIVYESNEIINYKTKDGKVASSSKEKLFFLIYSNGHHHFYSEPSKSIVDLKKAKEEIYLISNVENPKSVNPSTAKNKKIQIDGIVTSNSTKSEKEFVTIPVYYATDRKPSGSKEIMEFYTSERNIKNGIELGKYEVTVPATHKIGKLDLPNWWEIYKDDPEKFMQLKSLHQYNQNSFYSELNKAIQLSDEKDAFIFVHGYNNSIDDAAFRAAQLSYDLGFKGATIIYSWASKQKTSLYVADEDAINWTVPLFKSFLSKVLAETKASKLNIIAHSMGNRVLTNTLKELQTENSTIKFNQIILAAPDIDLEVFKRDIASKVVKSANQVTLYVSKKDKALLLSKKIHDDKRLGENLVVMNGIDTIDATDLTTDDYFGHAYFGETRSVIEDIAQLIKFNASPKIRNLIQMKNSEGIYWKLKR